MCMCSIVYVYTHMYTHMISIDANNTRVLRWTHLSCFRQAQLRASDSEPAEPGSAGGRSPRTT